jgi:hypothetical protein
LLPGRLHGPLEVVERRQQLAGQGGRRVTPVLGRVALNALLVVLEIRPGALEQGEVLVPLLLGSPQPDW